MITRKPVYFYLLIIFWLVSASAVSGFAVKNCLADEDMNSPEVLVKLIAQQPPPGSIPEIIENGYQRVYTTTTVPVKVEQLEEMRQSGKTPDIDPETGFMIIQSFVDYLPENWLFERSMDEPEPDLLTDSYGNPIVNQTPGLPDWAQRDVNALRTEIENTIELYWNATGSELRELEWVMGNFISQAIVRNIEFRDLVELSNQDVVSGPVADSILKYLHFYENLKYKRSLDGRFTYSASEYDNSIEEFINSHNKTLESVIRLEYPDENSRGALPSGCYTKSTSGIGLTFLASPTVIWDGSVGVYDDNSADIPIGFNFVFYGCQDYDVNSSVRVSTNGYISFYQQGGGAANGTNPMNVAISDEMAPDGYATAWWDEMVVYNNGLTDKIRYATEGAVGSREFTVDYYSISTFSQDTDNYHFYQIKLFEADGSVEFHYGGWAASSDDSATIGMENYFASGGDCGPNCGNLNNERPPNNYRFVPCYNIWSGNISTAWNNVNNWEPNRLPTDTINTIIPYRINNPLVGSPGATCSNLNVLSGAVFNTGSNTITTADILNYGTINAGSSHWYTKGDYHGGGTFNAGTSEVDFIGVYYAYIWGSPIFYDLDINKTNGTKTVLLSDVNVSRWVFTHSGDLDINGHTLTSNLCDIYGDNLINNTGTFILTGNGPYFHDGSNYICSAGVIDSVDNIEFQIGSTETISGGTIYLEGDFTAYDGNFTPTGGAVVFDGSGSSYINGSPDFFDMSVAKDSDSTTYGHSDFTVTNSLNLVSGRFDPNDYTVTIGK